MVALMVLFVSVLLLLNSLVGRFLIVRWNRVVIITITDILFQLFLLQGFWKSLRLGNSYVMYWDSIFSLDVLMKNVIFGRLLVFVVQWIWWQ